MMGNKPPEQHVNASEPLPPPQSYPAHLLTTKFLVPALPGTLIARPRLTALLNAGLQQPLMLVSAGAGFGKTTLLAAWVHSFAPGTRPVAWVSLDTGDNLPVQFWAYVLTALESCQPGLCTLTFAYLYEEPQPAWQSMLTALINSLAQRSERMLLVLDNYEAITEPTIHALVSFLVEHLPPTLCVVLSTRAEPPFSLARLRVRAQVQELRTEQLQFTREEATAFLREGMHLYLSEQEMQEVEARTQGWWAGLQLAALALQGRANPMDLLHELQGSRRAIREYLVHEVLQRQPTTLQTFLLRTSILERLSASLCNAVLEQKESQQVLEELERANLFLSPLDRQHHWYAYHPLFAEALRSNLEQTSPAEMSTLHLRASRWYAAHHFTNEAIRHALFAQDWSRAADLIEHIPSQRIWSRLEHALVPTWIEQLPPEAVRTRPRLCLTHAQALFWVTPSWVVEDWLRAARAAWAEAHAREGHPKGAEQAQASETPVHLLGEIAALQAVIKGFYDGDAGATQAFCQEALVFLSEQQQAARAQVVYAQALADVSLGHFESAIQKMQVESTLAQARGDPVVASLCLAKAGGDTTMAGRLHRAWQFTEQTLHLIQTPGGYVPASMCWSYARRADMLREWNRLEEAQNLAEQAIQLGEQTETFAFLPIGYTILLKIALSRGTWKEAKDAHQQMEAAWRTMPSPYRFALYSRVEQIRCWLACGDLEQARTWADGLEQEEPLVSPLARERQYIALARVRLAESKPDQVLAWLAPLVARAKATERWDQVLEMWLLQAQACQMRKMPQEALVTLARAVHLAEPEGYIRRFVDEGSPVADLLWRLREQEQSMGPTPYLDTLLAAFNQARVVQLDQQRVTHHPPTQPLLDPLSAREHEVLRLVAHGTPNQAIAETLAISLDTVRHHVSHILSKLEVTNRTQAVARARTLGLLSNAV